MLSLSIQTAAPLCTSLVTTETWICILYDYVQSQMRPCHFHAASWPIAMRRSPSKNACSALNADEPAVEDHSKPCSFFLSHYGIIYFDRIGVHMYKQRTFILKISTFIMAGYTWQGFWHMPLCNISRLPLIRFQHISMVFDAWVKVTAINWEGKKNTNVLASTVEQNSWIQLVLSKILLFSINFSIEALSATHGSAALSDTLGKWFHVNSFVLPPVRERRPSVTTLWGCGWAGMCDTVWRDG